MRNNRLIWIIMVSALVLCFVSTVFAAPKVKIVIWTWSQEQAAFFTEMEQQFEAANPDIDVQYVNTAQAQYRNSLPLAFRGDTAPDIFFESNQPAQVVDQGFARPLDEFVTSKFTAKFPKEYFYEGVCKINGKIYGLSQANYKIPRPIYFYYNKTVMKNAGLNPNKPPKTWGQLREMAKKITAAGKGQYYGLAMVGKPAHDLNRVLQAFSSTLGLQERSFDWKTGEFCQKDPGWIKLYEYIQSMKDEGSFFPGFASMAKELARTYFAQDKAAFYFDGLWLPSNFVSMGFTNINYGVAPPPVPDEGRTGYWQLTPTTAPFWYMSSQTKYPNEAWKYLEFMYSKTYQQKFVAGNFGYSPLKNFGDEKYVTDPILKEIIKMPELAKLAPIPVIRNPKTGKVTIFDTIGAIHPTIWESMTAALIGEADFQKEAGILYDKVNAEFEKQMKENNLTREDFIFKNWNPKKDYTIDMYSK